MALTMEAQYVRALLNSAGLGPIVLSGEFIGHADGASSITFPAELGVKITTSDGTARQYVTNATIAAADTWERIVGIALPADATATIDSDTGEGLRIDFGLYSEQKSTGDAWEAVDNAEYGTSASANWADAVNNYVGWTNLKLERGAVSTPFSYSGAEAAADELSCKRYLRGQTRAATADLLGWGYNTQTTTAESYRELSPAMRASPTTTFSSGTVFQVRHGTSTTQTTAMAASASTPQNVTVTATVASGLTAGQGSSLQFHSTVGAQILYSAEL